MTAFRVTVDRDDDKCRFFSTHADDQVTLTMGPDVKPILGHWTNYPATAVKRMSTNFAEGGLLGVDMSIACDIPVASGRGVRSVHACSRFDVAPCPLIDELLQQQGCLHRLRYFVACGLLSTLAMRLIVGPHSLPTSLHRRI